jgi:hypothetical protein
MGSRCRYFILQCRSEPMQQFCLEQIGKKKHNLLHGLAVLYKNSISNSLSDYLRIHFVVSGSILNPLPKPTFHELPLQV